MSNIKGSRNSIIVPSVSPLVSFLFLSFLILCNFYWNLLVIIIIQTFCITGPSNMVLIHQTPFSWGELSLGTRLYGDAAMHTSMHKCSYTHAQSYTRVCRTELYRNKVKPYVEWGSTLTYLSIKLDTIIIIIILYSIRHNYSTIHSKLGFPQGIPCPRPVDPTYNNSLPQATQEWLTDLDTVNALYRQAWFLGWQPRSQVCGAC